MKFHYLQFKHQKILLELIVQWMLSERHVSKNYFNRLAINRDLDKSVRQELVGIQEVINTSVPIVASLLSECQRLRFEHDQITMKCESLVSLKQETRKMINGLNETVDRCIAAQNETREEIDSIKNLKIFTRTVLLDTKGTATFSFTKRSSEMNVPFSMSSSIFKTSPFGYHFKLRVCSTIEAENEKQEYLSVYITMVRGDFDPILVYPFLYTIYLCLCDQSRQRKHIVSIIKPDPNSSSFICPINEINDEVGIVKFCPLSFLKDVKSTYSEDGIFFIRIFMDFMNTGVNPFMESLNDLT